MVEAHITLADLNSQAEKVMEEKYTGFTFTGFRGRQMTIDIDGEIVRKCDGQKRPVTIMGYDVVNRNEELYRLAESKISEAVAAMPEVA